MTSGHVAHVRKLYKLILRLHRNLPDELRFLGDSYAKEEFRRHKKCKPAEAQIFLKEWKDYASTMFQQVSPTRAQRQSPQGEEPRAVEEEFAHDITIPLGPPPAPPAPINGEKLLVRPVPRYGNQLPAEIFVRLSNDQMYQLYELEAVAARQDVGDVVVDVFEDPNIIEALNALEPDIQAVSNAQEANGQAPDAQEPDIQAAVNEQEANVPSPRQNNDVNDNTGQHEKTENNNKPKD